MNRSRFHTRAARCALPLLLASAAAFAAPTLEDYAAPASVEMMSLSPDGRRVAFRTHQAEQDADGYLRFVEYARRLWQLQRADFIDRNFDGPRDLLTANLLRLLAAGGFRRLQPKINSFFRDERTRRIFSFQSMYAGLAPHDALALYAVIAYLDAVAGVYFPKGGIGAVPRALAGAAEKHGVEPARVEAPQVQIGIRHGDAGPLAITHWPRVSASATPRIAACEVASPK